MNLVKTAWKILVGIKDGLVLIAMLLFFGVLFAALSSRPGPAINSEGALVIKLDGPIVEQPAEADPFEALAGGDVPKQYRLRDVLHVLRTAKDDERVKAVVLELDGFGGGYPAALNEVAQAVREVRDAKKPVLAYATAYSDGSYRLAAAASEIWMHPMGGTLFSGPGGSRLYYKGLIDKLGVNTHVYRVGKFKSFVEPYIRTDMSPEAREASAALQGVIFDQWKAAIAAARPKAKFEATLLTPGAVITGAQGDIAKANIDAGIVDKLGDRLAFDKRVAALAGAADKKAVTGFKAIRFANYLNAHPISTSGDKIGVITVAGDIVDGKAGNGTAGGDTIAKLLLDRLAKKDLKALVVRVDSPGGSALASETIRQAVLEAKAQKLPVVISMASVAASGGYWVATAGDIIFAEPTTITGSIGIFGIIPTFEKSLAKIGITSDGVKTTPLTGQPDVTAGTNAETDAVLQSAIENGYRQFLTRVATARKITIARADEIGQGRVWDGGTARQLGLVDRFGTMDDALAEAARRAKLDPAKVHAVYLEKEPDGFAKFLASFAGNDDEEDAAEPQDAFARIAAERRAVLARAIGDVERLARGSSIQARCLECAGLAPISAGPREAKLLDMVLAKLAG